MTEGQKVDMDYIRSLLSPTISNDLAAKVLKMNPSRLAEYAKTGQLEWHTIISGNRVKHSRIGFIKFWDGDGT